LTGRLDRLAAGLTALKATTVAQMKRAGPGVRTNNLGSSNRFEV